MSMPLPVVEGLSGGVVEYTMYSVSISVNSLFTLIFWRGSSVGVSGFSSRCLVLNWRDVSVPWWLESMMQRMSGWSRSSCLRRL